MSESQGDDKPDWKSRVQELKRAIGELRNLPPDERERRKRELSAKIRKTLHEEDLPGQPEWVAGMRERNAQTREHQRNAAPVIAEIRGEIDKATGKNWGHNLDVGASVGFKSMRFDVWYDTDAALEQDRSTSRLEEFSRIIREIAARIAGAPATVYFHSHQFVREKCGGNYFNYLR